MDTPNFKKYLNKHWGGSFEGVSRDDVMDGFAKNSVKRATTLQHKWYPLNYFIKRQQKPEMQQRSCYNFLDIPLAKDIQELM